MATMLSHHKDTNMAKGSDVVLSVKGVSKKFCRDLKRSLMYGITDIGSEILGLRGDKNAALRNKEFWALQDVSLELRRGEALGLVGKNGSGKSTLLRIIAGLIKPDVGEVAINGRVAPLIALGAGFNPILTGRENIYANMSILGLTKEEINEQFEEVLDFAEIGDAVDSPVQSYSSGMQARLGFSCAVHTNPDILLIDEVLAVGDVKFRAKCRRKLHNLREQGKSFILVTHQTQAIISSCNSAVYLSQGNLIDAGNPSEIMSRYESELFASPSKAKGRYVAQPKSDKESTGVDIVSLFFRDQEGNIIHEPATGEKAVFCAEYKSCLSADNCGLNLAIYEAQGEGDYVLHLSSFKDNQELQIFKGQNELQVIFPYLGLKPGTYLMKVNIRKDSLYMFDMVDSFMFTVANKLKQPIADCLFHQPRQWNAQKSEA